MKSENKLQALFSDLKNKQHKHRSTALDFFKYIGPGFLVTVGFIDPGNWATNLAAGSQFGYHLLWVISISTIMLIILQHNAAHLGIASGLCLSEAINKFLPKKVSVFILTTGMIASIATSFAELLGAAIALKVLFGINIYVGAFLSFVFITVLLLTNKYSRVEKWIIGFVTIIALSFIYELYLVDIKWVSILRGSFEPTIPHNSMFIIVGVLGAIIMPHNFFLHSEIIQSRQWNLNNDKIIKKQLKFEFFDTLFTMIVGWAINCSIIILAASTFYEHQIVVTDLEQSHLLLKPLLGNLASLIFGIALLFTGIASSITSGISGGIIFAGLCGEQYDIKDNHTRLGIIISLFMGMIAILFINNSYFSLIFSQVILSVQLPLTIFSMIYLTSSKKVMGKYKNTKFNISLLVFIGLVLMYFNFRLIISLF